MKMETIYQAVLDGDIVGCPEAVQAALDDGVPVEQILKEGLIAPMGEVGRLFEEGEIFVPEMLVSARTMQSGLELLRPLLVESDIKPAGKVAIGTVKGDLHDIGKNLVGMMLEGAGFEVIDLGNDVDAQTFVDAVKGGVDIIGLSALLTTTMTQIENVIKVLNDANMRDRVKVMIGGAPVTPEYAMTVGADAYAADASGAVRSAKELMGIV